jgi:UDP-N-acetylmuramate dehydrogenase
VYADIVSYFAGKSNPKPLDIYEAVKEIRDRKGMLIDPENLSADSRSAGSFFKNPVVSARVVKDILETLPPDEGTMPQWPTPDGRVKLAAAWLIEHSGFKKGYALGRVGISSKHTLALVNRTGDASCEELLRLRDLIVLTVEQRFGVTLVMEPVMLG